MTPKQSDKNRQFYLLRLKEKEKRICERNKTKQNKTKRKKTANGQWPLHRQRCGRCILFRLAELGDILCLLGIIRSKCIRGDILLLQKDIPDIRDQFVRVRVSMLTLQNGGSK